MPWSMHKTTHDKTGKNLPENNQKRYVVLFVVCVILCPFVAAQFYRTLTPSDIKQPAPPPPPNTHTNTKTNTNTNTVHSEEPQEQDDFPLPYTCPTRDNCILDAPYFRRWDDKGDLAKITSRLKVLEVQPKTDPNLFYIVGIHWGSSVGWIRPLKNILYSYLVVLNSTGSPVAVRRVPRRIWVPQFYNSSTIYFLSTSGDTRDDISHTQSFFLINTRTTGYLQARISGATHDVSFTDPKQAEFIWLQQRDGPFKCNHKFVDCGARRSFPKGKIRVDTIIRSSISPHVRTRKDTNWHGTVFFDGSLALRKTFPVNIDLTHFNTIVHLPHEQAILVNSRTLSTFYKLNTTTRSLVWGIGEYGTMEMQDREQNKGVDKLFEFAHGVWIAGEDEFVLFDNHNINNNFTGDEWHSSLKKIKIRNKDSDTVNTEQTQKDSPNSNQYAEEVWRWSPPMKYRHIFNRAEGGWSAQTSDGLIVGTFGQAPDHYLAAVRDEETDLVVKFVGTGFIYGINPFYNHPWVELVNAPSGGMVTIACHNTVWQPYPTKFTLECLGGKDGTTLTEHQFLPYWQRTIVTKPVTGGNTLRIVNSDGVASEAAMSC
eukprot:TRINITY_DN66573_c6_g1_i1.p1 TRINITY_DN66573_c6_g1~~TRINITY_DN66573_c6_g1_i1.p1  ORF type:complete len:597 (+),score=45.69 TRINITY_DN66573_c6_g1_i1:65-1855(+)